MGARKSCSTREINVVFPSTHVFFCLLYKGQSYQTKYIENQVTSTSNGLFNKILTSFNFSKQT